MAKLSTQSFLQIEDIKGDSLILKDKSLRGLISVSSINFALKSEEEQKSVIYQFQDFLNSLDFPLQIICQSRQLNITGYLESLNDIASKQENELLKIQTVEYKKFIEELISKQVIMTKAFYVVIPLYPAGVDNAKSAVGGVLGKKEKSEEGMSEEKFRMAKDQLLQRMEFIAGGLARCGLKSTLLNTTELIELFWSNHHPSEAETGYYPEIPDELKNK
jgi:hypothetical protein